MALSEKSRTTIYQHMTSVLGEEASAEMLSYFPARDVEEPATKELVLLTRAELQADIAEVRVELADVRVEIEKLRADVMGEIGGLRGDFEGLRGDFEKLRGGFEKLRGETRGDIEALRADMHQSLQRLTFAIIATIVAFGGVLLSASAMFQS
jgi:hypothetical protein